MRRRNFIHLNRALSTGLATFLLSLLPISAIAIDEFPPPQQLPPSYPPSLPPPPPPPVVAPPPPPPPVAPAPSPSFTLPPPLPQAPFFNPPIIVPTDVTSPALGHSEQLSQKTNIESVIALNGIQTIANSKFPESDKLKGNSDWIIVRGQSEAEYDRPSPYTVNLKSGSILVSVKRPSELAIINTDLGDIAVGSNGDVIITRTANQLRIANLDGNGQTVKIRLDKGPFLAQDPTMTLAAGYELVADNHKLTARDIKINDGWSRRYFQTLENGNLAVCEFSTESVLHTCPLIAELKQEAADIKARRMIGDMSKMAAVLNYMHGTTGFTAMNDQALFAQR